MEPNKPARYKTTGFWFTLVTVISGSLLLLGVIGEHTRDQVIDVGQHVVESIAMVVGMGGLLGKHCYNKYKNRSNPKPPTKRRRRKPKLKDDECQPPPSKKN